MLDLLSNPAWTGIGAIFTILTFIGSLIVEFMKQSGKTEISTKNQTRSANTDSIMSFLFKLVDALGGNGGVILIMGSLVMGAILAIVMTKEAPRPSAIAYYAFGFALPGLWGIHRIRNRPERWAIELSYNYFITVGYYLAIILVTSIIYVNIGRPDQNLFGLFKASEFLVLFPLLLIIVCTVSSWSAVLLPVAWAMIYQKAGRKDYRDLR